MNWLLELDQDLLLAINGWNSEFGDQLMWWISNKYSWIPVYVLVLEILIRKYGWKNALWILLMAVPLIVLADQLSSGLLKPWIARPRPCKEEVLQPLLHLVNGKCGGEYGFVSSHSANFFALATYLGSFFERRWRILAFGLATLVGFSRIYLGVHYPGDVLGGACLGVLVGMSIVFIFRFFLAPRVHFPLLQRR